MTGPLRTVRLGTLGAMASAWDDLAAAADVPSPFLRSWWLDHAAAGESAIICCLDDDGLLGGAAFEVDRFGPGIERVRCLGQGELAPDHLDVVALPDRREEVVGAVLAWLRRDGSRLVDLDGLRADGLLADRLSRYIIERTVAPWASLRADGGGPDGTAYLAGRSGQVRSNVSRTRKRLQKSGCTVARVGIDEVDRALDDLARLHDGRWGEHSGFLGAWDRFRAAAAVGLARGEIWATEARTDDGTVVATEWDLLTPTSVAFYQAGRSLDRDWRGAGSVVRADVVLAAAETGRLEYDLLRGEEPYKQDWATGTRQLVRVRFGVGPVGRAAATGAALWRRAAPVVATARERLGRHTA